METKSMDIPRVVEKRYINKMERVRQSKPCIDCGWERMVDVTIPHTYEQEIERHASLPAEILSEIFIKQGESHWTYLCSACIKMRQAKELQARAIKLAKEAQSVYDRRAAKEVACAKKS